MNRAQVLYIEILVFSRNTPTPVEAGLEAAGRQELQVLSDEHQEEHGPSSASSAIDCRLERGPFSPFGAIDCWLAHMRRSDRVVVLWAEPTVARARGPHLEARDAREGADRDQCRWWWVVRRRVVGDGCWMEGVQVFGFDSSLY